MLPFPSPFPFPDTHQGSQLTLDLLAIDGKERRRSQRKRLWRSRLPLFFFLFPWRPRDRGLSPQFLMYFSYREEAVFLSPPLSLFFSFGNPYAARHGSLLASRR